MTRPTDAALIAAGSIVGAAQGADGSDLGWLTDERARFARAVVSLARAIDAEAGPVERPTVVPVIWTRPGDPGNFPPFGGEQRG